MALSSTAQPYLIDGMASNKAGQNLINAIQTHVPLSTSSNDFIRLESCFGNNQIAINFNNCIGGTYQLQLQDVQYVKAAFSLDLLDLQNVLSNLAGGYNPSININYI